MTDRPGGGWANPAWGEPMGAPVGHGTGPPQPPGAPAYGSYAGFVDPAPVPGPVPLRPLGVGEMLDGALSIIRRHPRITIGLAAVIVTVEQTISVVAQVSTGSIGGSV
ncbi:MAG: hypothetical protein LC713_07725, partial [Actinobacteria bacterium]|nr:hypothetical protein [Actinomycetota bacterium]